MTGEPELLTEADDLYCRLVPNGNVGKDADGRLGVLWSAFARRNPDTGKHEPDPKCSVAVKRMTSAEATRSRGGARFGVCELSAKEPLSMGLEVVHDPLDGDDAHAEVRGLRKRAECQQLAEASVIVLPPTP